MNDLNTLANFLAVAVGGVAAVAMVVAVILYSTGDIER